MLFILMYTINWCMFIETVLIHKMVISIEERREDLVR